MSNLAVNTCIHNVANVSIDDAYQQERTGCWVQTIHVRTENGMLTFSLFADDEDSLYDVYGS